MFKKKTLLQNIALGAAVVVLSVGAAWPAAAKPLASDDMATIQTPGVFCWWFGWC